MSLTTPDCRTEFPVFFRNIEGFTPGVVFPNDVPTTFADGLPTFVMQTNIYLETVL